MGHSREDKARSHERIVEITAGRIREAGLDGPAVAAIMQEAGLTHGGFYKHFGSREDLVAEAAERSFAESEQTVAAAIDGAADPLGALVELYLSASHRDQPGTGCAVAALSADVPRADGRVQAAFSEQVSRYIARLQDLLPSTGAPGADRARATAAVSTLVGALLLARAVDDPALSEEILGAGRGALLDERPGGRD